jgi:hypothetical protein
MRLTLKTAGSLSKLLSNTTMKSHYYGTSDQLYVAEGLDIILKCPFPAVKVFFATQPNKLEATYSNFFGN